MPDPSPPAAATAYLERLGTVGKGVGSTTRSGVTSSGLNNEKKKGKKKSLNVVMLGLSLMGQPWQSLGCPYSDLVVDGAMSSDVKGGDLVLPVKGIRAHGGVCLGYHRDKIPSFHPLHLHTNYTMQNSETCSADHSYAVYASPDPTQSTAKVCFIYLFNIFKNIKPGTKLPCNLELEVYICMCI
jgi:hypothetical protein